MQIHELQSFCFRIGMRRDPLIWQQRVDTIFGDQSD